MIIQAVYGQKTQISLVICLTGAPYCSPARALQQVNAGDYQAFWLWSGVKPGAEMRAARTVYLHQGDGVPRRGQIKFERLGLPVSHLNFPQMWLTVRINTLDIADEMLMRIIRLMQRWRLGGNHVIGLQIDFDAATWRLEGYGQFLQRLRNLMPAEYALGVTGLPDWAKTGHLATLNALPIVSWL